MTHTEAQIEQAYNRLYVRYRVAHNARSTCAFYSGRLKHDMDQCKLRAGFEVNIQDSVHKLFHAAQVLLKLAEDEHVDEYLIAFDSYMGLNPGGMEKFRGTWRELLFHLNGVTDKNRNEWFDFEDYTIQEMGGATRIEDVPTEFFEKLFNDANGDGQPYYMVWSVAEGKKVLG